MKSFFYILSAISGALAVGIGAFGAHGLKQILEANQRIDTFNTGVQYHFYHTFALLAVAIIMQNQDSKWLNYAGWSYIVGILLFSGSLYILSLTNITKLGAITPLGGVAFIAGWILMLLHFVKQ